MLSIKGRDGKIITMSQEKAEIFIGQFLTIGEKLVDALPAVENPTSTTKACGPDSLT